MTDTLDASPIAPHHRLAKWAGIFLFIAVPLAYAHDGHDIVRYVKLLVAQVGTFAMTIAWFMGAYRGDIPHRRYPLDLPIILFLLVNVISWATMAINPFKSGIEVVKIFTFTTLYFATSRTFHPSFFKPWVYIITLITAIISIIGICQYLGIGFLWLRSSGYPSATLVYRNFAAMYLIMAIPFSCIPFLISKKLWHEIGWGMIAILPIIFLIFTRTRGAWVGLAGSILLTGLAYWTIQKKFQKPTHFTRHKLSLSLGLFALIIGSTQLPIQIAHPQGIDKDKIEFTQTLESIVQKQDMGRSDIWRHTLALIKDHWSLGVGLGNWELIYPAYDRGAILYPGHTARRPHNDLLWIWSELGIIGLVLFISIIILTMKCLWRLFQASSNHFIYQQIPFLCISLMAIMGHALFSFPAERIPPLMLVHTILGILSASNTKPTIVFFSSLKIMPALMVLCLTLGLQFSAKAIQADRYYGKQTQYRFQNDWPAVLQTADQALEYGPITHWVLFWKAHAWHMLGDIPLALQTYKDCLKYHPNEMLLYWKIGRLEQIQGNLKRAQIALEQAVYLDTDNADFYQDLGAIYQLQHKYPQAREAYLKSLSLKDFYEKTPNPETFLNLGRVYEAMRQPEAAIKTYQQFLNTKPTNDQISAVIRQRLHSLQKENLMQKE